MQNTDEVLADPSLQQVNALDAKDSALNSTTEAPNVAHQENKPTESLTSEVLVETKTDEKAETISSIANTNAVAQVSSLNQDNGSSV